jgi:hypothetical protein
MYEYVAVVFYQYLADLADDMRKRRLPPTRKKYERKYYNKKFWEELIAYFPFTVILISVTTSRKKTSACTRKEVNETIQFWRL